MYGCFNIHLQTFFYRHSFLLHTLHPTSPHKHTHAPTTNPPYAFMSTVTAFSPRAEKPEAGFESRAEPRLSVCNGGKSFISVQCPGPISALPLGYSDPLLPF